MKRKQLACSPNCYMDLGKYCFSFRYRCMVNNKSINFALYTKQIFNPIPHGRTGQIKNLEELYQKFGMEK